MVPVTAKFTGWLYRLFKKIICHVIRDSSLVPFPDHRDDGTPGDAARPGAVASRRGAGCHGKMWTVRLEGGPRRVNHAAVAINGKVYSFGGYCTGEDYNTRKPIDVHVLNTVSLRWALVQTQSHPDDVPFQRYGHTVVAYGDYAYLWGGRNDDGACNILYRFDTNTLTWSRPKVCGHVPGARDGHSACVMGNRMYVFGGFEEQADRFSQDVHYLDLETMLWQYVPTRGQPPQWRDFHSSSAIGGRMYVWGGRGDSQGPYHSQSEVYCNRMAFLDTATSCWVHPRVDGVPPEGRRSHSAFVYNGELYIFGGYNGLLLTHFGDMHKYDPENSCWSQVKIQRDGPCARRRQCCCMVGDRLFLFGGTSPTPNQVARQRMEEFDANDLTLMDHSDLHVLDFAPTLKTLCLLAVIDARMDISHLPQDIRWEISAMTTNNSISRPSQTTG
ncbi:kelch domain-containing protein 3-like isoform X1 [Dermacentor silvarum]|uniref:kelch domain-containing protein 3-like isoform X1 n=2 Tax=Dermacentor silvarum TaxID=543639 RepID=UPI001896EB1B|nr:kelch domain-containing protein 3-like isoform X1 [Dermacentor silvarum]